MKKLICVLVIFTALSGALFMREAGAANCPPGSEVSVSVSGNQFVGIGSTVTYTCTLETGEPNGTYTWTHPGFSGSSSSSTIQLTAPATASASVGDKSITCRYTAPSGECAGSDSINVTIVKIEVEPTTMDVIESLDSDEFTCKVTPSGLSPTYNWLTGAANGAWPASAGNSPALQYSAPTSKKTKISKTRWFAPTGSNDIMTDGPDCEYGIGVEVTLNGTTLMKQSAATMTVSVDTTGHCDEPKMINSLSIATAQSNGLWIVVGQGQFARTAPVPHVNCAATSQFVGKFKAHEEEHEDQFLTQLPWKDLFDADSLYSSTLSSLTNTNEVLLRASIWLAVENKKNDDYALMAQNMLAAERGAFAVENAHSPDFLEYVNEADWRAEYGL